ncbi:MAG: response regulator [Candidatus Omnitrophica bacterium]|nr:response regulator [Candidatus Omnitrophota bacterium]
MLKTILVVDDDRLATELSKRKLEERGYGVLVASNGNEALECLKAQIPDLIILDVHMPDMNGYTFIIEKNKNPQYVNIPVVMVTASSETGPLFKRHRVKGYLLKPINMQELLDKVSEVVGPAA